MGNTIPQMVKIMNETLETKFEEQTVEEVLNALLSKPVKLRKEAEIRQIHTIISGSASLSRYFAKLGDIPRDDQLLVCKFTKKEIMDAQDLVILEGTSNNLKVYFILKGYVSVRVLDQKLKLHEKQEYGAIEALWQVSIWLKLIGVEEHAIMSQIRALWSRWQTEKKRFDVNRQAGVEPEGTVFFTGMPPGPITFEKLQKSAANHTEQSVFSDSSHPKTLTKGRSKEFQLHKQKSSKFSTQVQLEELAKASSVHTSLSNGGYAGLEGVVKLNQNSIEIDLDMLINPLILNHKDLSLFEISYDEYERNNRRDLNTTSVDYVIKSKSQFVSQIVEDGKTKDYYKELIVKRYLGGVIRNMGPAECFGERALQGGRNIRTASVICESSCEYLTLGAEEYIHFIKISANEKRDRKFALLRQLFVGLVEITYEKQWEFVYSFNVQHLLLTLEYRR